MSVGGGFCELHGPYDPPHQECPYCAKDQAERQVYGPPQQTIPHPAAPPAPDASDDDYRRITVEPEPPDHPGLTEMIPREDAPDQPADVDSQGVPVPPGPPLLGWFVIRQPVEQRGTIIPIEAGQVIGREGQIRWNDPRMSRQHARLTMEPPADTPGAPPEFHIWPFGPTNPVRINGQEVRGATPLRENDEIQLGDTLVVFKLLRD